jgi:preprotein translocase subunit SecF
MNFMRFKWLYFFISALVLVPGIYSLIVWGLKPSIDFTGGSLLELRFEQEVKIEEVENILKEKEVEISSRQPSGDNVYLFRTKPIDKNKNQEIQAALSEKFGQTEEVRFETVGPTLGKELVRKTTVAVVLAAGFILLYVGFRFGETKYGVCAILAMFHDTLILGGVFSLLGHFREIEIDTLFVTAVLTTLSFSVHDTVVIYDQIRESLRTYPQASFKDLANQAIEKTLIRSLNNSLTIIFVLLALWLLGGETIRWFVLALLIGTIAGTYSSTFVAVPLLDVWENFLRRFKR